MKAPLFSEILEICQAIAQASSDNDDNQRTKQYQALIKLCAANENSPKDHPLQWEALADFTNDSEQAIEIYQKGLVCAEKLNYADYIASIYLSMAQRYQEMELTDKAVQAATHSFDLIEQVENKELCSDISEYYQQLTAE
ncbi:hypothetical protein [Thalassotalea sp. G2M2-11]|uniref:hypothetical protein n=1 Tax=Thalassotalea sp. G2M2-11 TaxID=2787627 RepID=UPI0019D2271D|nr:hypothetical protein [Thalassotalea sp. G2M2-11]